MTFTFFAPIVVYVMILWTVCYRIFTNKILCHVVRTVCCNNLTGTITHRADATYKVAKRKAFSTLCSTHVDKRMFKEGNMHVNTAMWNHNARWCVQGTHFCGHAFVPLTQVDHAKLGIVFETETYGLGAFRCLVSYCEHGY